MRVGQWGRENSGGETTVRAGATVRAGQWGQDNSGSGATVRAGQWGQDNSGSGATVRAGNREGVAMQHTQSEPHRDLQ